jgi:hypothetical protein
LSWLPYLKQIIQSVGIGRWGRIEIAGGGIHEKENKGREAERQAHIGQIGSRLPQKGIEPGKYQPVTKSDTRVKKL